MRAWTPTTSSTCMTASRCGCHASLKAAVLHAKPVKARLRPLSCSEDWACAADQAS